MAMNILVSGATGRQGGAVLSALSNMADARKTFNVYALSRNIDSPSVKGLSSKHPRLHIKPISGSFDDCPAIFAACDAQISHVFAVQAPAGIASKILVEEIHGKAFIDAAAMHGVRVFVQASVDRGPDSDNEPTNVAHFAAKFNIEKHLETTVARPDCSMTYTILRPTSFMDNFAPGFLGQLIASSWKSMLSDNRKMQLIATKDIGRFAARALIESESKTFKNQKISLAGDELTWTEANEVYKVVTGEEMPRTYSLVLWGVSLMVKELQQTMDFVEEKGYAADISRLQEIEPRMTSFKTWIEENIPKRDRNDMD